MLSLFSLSNLQLSLVPIYDIYMVLLTHTHNDQEHLKDIESDDEEVTIDDSLTIKSISEVLQLVNRITCFTRQYEDGKVNESLEVVTEKLQDIMIRNKQQKKITDYFNL